MLIACLFISRCAGILYDWLCHRRMLVHLLRAINYDVSDPWPEGRAQRRLGLANTACALATLGVRQERLVGAIAGRALRALLRLEEFNPQEVANTTWALATLGVQQDELLGARAGRALVRLGFANTAWAFATLAMRQEELLGAIARKVQMSRWGCRAGLSQSRCPKLEGSSMKERGRSVRGGLARFCKFYLNFIEI